MELTNNIFSHKILGDSELDSVIETAFKILEKTGFIIMNIKILYLLKNFGAKVDESSQKVFISKSLMQDILGKLNRKRWGETTQVFTAEPEIYKGYFLDPGTTFIKHGHMICYCPILTGQ